MKKVLEMKKMWKQLMNWWMPSSILVSIIDESSSTEKLLLLELVTSEVADSGVGI